MLPDESSTTSSVSADTASVSSGSAPASTSVGTGGGAGSSSGSGGSVDYQQSAGTDWDVGAWDGNADSVHASYKPFYERVNSDWEARHKSTSDDLNIYRDIVSGLGEDPRMGENQAKFDALQKKYDALNAEWESGRLGSKQATDRTAQLEKAYGELLDRQAAVAVTAFKEKYKDIVGEPAKRQELVNLMDEGWDEEAAAMLVGKTSQMRERAVAIVKEHQLRGSGHRLAVSQAMSELNPKNISAPGALLTAGANGTVNPVRTSDRNIRNLSRESARTEAARLALVPSRSR